ncbi:MAG: hypothetical protein P8N40_09300 [Gammaproteobacteria bacterium]|nr:hypothetical protein [Gammaproteobacteria bacterium]
MSPTAARELVAYLMQSGLWEMRLKSMRRVSTVIAFLLVNAALLFDASAQQSTRPLRPPSPEGTPVIPFMEGWYANDDGTVTVSFGYHNRNAEDIIVPLGENNRIEPARFDGMQPEIYFPGRHPGVFTVTIPASMQDESIWWYIRTGNLEELRVPGRRGSDAYELDRNPRPQGSMEPLVWFENEDRGSGPEGILAVDTKTIPVGLPLTLEFETEDPSMRDPSNPLFAKPLDTRVIWYKHQGPGEVIFIEHAASPFIKTPARTTPASKFPLFLPPASSSVTMPAGKGIARVSAKFSEPGEYMIRARVDNWGSPDSGGLFQCCWSNAYQRVRVTE